jgi:exonuclease VII small subunit
MALKESKETNSFKNHLKEISEILEWFDSQEELDVELALEKITKASALIKSSKQRLVQIENEFKEIKKEVEES